MPTHPPHFSCASLVRTALPAAVAAAFLTVCTTSLAEGVSEKVAGQLRAAISANTGNSVRVDEIRTTPIKGIYEVLSEGEIFYADETGRYSFIGGSLMDLKQRVDLTARVQDKRMAIPFDQLPLKHAIKEVHGNGSRLMAVFEDPNCPICRVFTKFVDQIDDVTVYQFMLPVISPQSQSLARMAWCSPDRAGVWKAMMDGARPKLSEACNVDGLVEILRTGERYQINNTPTVVLASGKRLVGATPPEQFLEELEKGGRVGGRK
ncbi:disulfide isomerase [Delftia sp. GW456-R20]|uniref:DsbC family protein n=1 Tax=Delftia sp. GW456-R20 TaxID=1827145 RepID=UPI0007AE9C59|nr:DsbC family protein [Delftia sp. GW456-R20]KZK27576.1 disulfide isomerase [Delftia sp. GW456-R20]